MLWGSSFVVIKGALTDIPPSVVTAVRFSVAALCFTPFLKGDRRLIWIGLELGVWIWGGYTTQAIGLLYTTVNRSAFITSLYVIGVPVVFWILGRSARWLFWVAAGLALFGVGLLSYEGTPPNLGDLWTLFTALCYTIYIWRLEGYATRFNVLSLSGTQLCWTALLSLLWVGVTQPVWLLPMSWGEIPWRSLVYLGIFVTALTTLFQTWGQRFVPATHASVLFTLEPVWASAIAFLAINERLGPQGLAGAGAIVVATLLCQFAGAPKAADV